MEEKERIMSDMDWEQRTLCRDESCIGVIGPDGRCKECGLLYNGEVKSEQSNEGSSIDQPDSSTDYNEHHDEALSETDDAWENRTLCRDENCIGVVGPDGKCKECGLPYNQL